MWEAKNRENTLQRKTIICTRQYLRGSVIYLRLWSCRDYTIIREKYKSATTIFSLSQKTRRQHNKTLITKLCFLHKTGQKNFLGPLYGLSLKKYLIKNHAILFELGHQTGSNKIRLHKAITCNSRHGCRYNMIRITNC